MKKTSVDYNQIASVYNERYKTSPLDGVANYLDNLLTKYKPRRVMEIGCGTGHWLNHISTYDCHFYGCDYSIGMLKEFKKLSSGKIKLVNCDANALPFDSEKFDLIFCINAIHHFRKKQKFIHDTANLLNKNGLLCIIGLAPYESKNSWYLYKYFARAYEIDQKRFPSFEKLRKWMEQEELNLVDYKLVHQVNSRKYGEEILEDHFLDKRGASQLALLTDEEYEIGLTKIKSDIDEAKRANKKIEFNTNLNFYTITGIKTKSN